MKWYEVKVETASEAVEAVANILVESGASGVSIEDALDAANWESDAFGEIADKSALTDLTEGARVAAYFPETVFLPEILPFMQERVAALPTFGLAIGKNDWQITEVSDADWSTAWKKYYHPVRITRYLTILPSWESYTPASPEEKVITLDPGMAFGTGTHPTTRLSLQALEVILRGGERVLDVGTGSGVLSIAAKYLGTGKVTAYDLDEVAVRSAKENLDLNPVAQDVEVYANNLLNGVAEEADVIVANILAEIILLLIPDAYRLLKPNGRFVVSGIIHDKVDEVLEAMYAEGFEVDQLFKQQDWYAIILKKAEE